MPSDLNELDYPPTTKGRMTISAVLPYFWFKNIEYHCYVVLGIYFSQSTSTYFFNNYHLYSVLFITTYDIYIDLITIDIIMKPKPVFVIFLGWQIMGGGGKCLSANVGKDKCPGGGGGVREDRCWDTMVE